MSTAQMFREEEWRLKGFCCSRTVMEIVKTSNVGVLFWFLFLFLQRQMNSDLSTASEGQRASASYDDAPSCQIHGAQSHPTAGEQHPRHTCLSAPSPVPLFVLIGTHVFINPFLHLLIYLLNKNSCSLEGEAVYIVRSTSADI